ncbi:MAG TPA: LysE family translocator [Thermoanaerobaculia bacterium]|nr:LysE family translocator [Thermoanaerobaculia bacterium]
MSPSHLLLFAATELLLSMTPGPAVLLVVSLGMRRGLASSRRGAAGILTGNAIYFALSAAGLGALLIASKRVFDILQIAGAAYLILLGLKMLVLASRRVDESTSRRESLEASKTRRLDGSFLQGLLTQLANPKAIVFFTALLPQFVDSSKPMTMQFLILGVISILVELPVLLAYGFAADRGRAVYGKHAPLIERLSGACLVAAGAKLAATRM